MGLRLAHAAGFLPSSYLNDSDEGGRDWRDRDMDELTQVMVTVMVMVVMVIVMVIVTVMAMVMY